MPDPEFCETCGATARALCYVNSHSVVSNTPNAPAPAMVISQPVRDIQDGLAQQCWLYFSIYILRHRSPEDTPLQPRNVFGEQHEINEEGLKFWRDLATSTAVAALDPLKRMGTAEQHKQIGTLIDQFRQVMQPDPMVVSIRLEFKDGDRVIHKTMGAGVVIGYRVKHDQCESSSSERVDYMIRCDNTILNIQIALPGELTEEV